VGEVGEGTGEVLFSRGDQKMASTLLGCGDRKGSSGIIQTARLRPRGALANTCEIQSAR
jgi:hypothetical protein